MNKYAYVSIDHDESDSINGYKGVIVEYKGNTTFYTGDPVVDWANAIIHLSKNGATKIMYSSSCDHFVMDVCGFGWNDQTMLVRI